MSLAVEFAIAYPEFRALRMEETEKSLILIEFGPNDKLSVFADEQEWTVYAGPSHGHFDSKAEAFETAAGVLKSTVRTCVEYRGEQLAQTWLEFKAEGDTWEVRHRAVFLSPFDAEDWNLQSGERWKQTHTAYAYDPESGEVTRKEFDVFPEGPFEGSSNIQDWLTQGLGPANEGMRWILGGHSRFVLQAPVGWRRVRTNEQQNFEDYAPNPARFVFRPMAYFRPSEEPHPVVEGAATRPKSTDYTFSDADANWHEHKWQILFSDGEEDMLGVVYLYFQPEFAHEAEEYRALIEASIPKFLQTTDNWNCKDIAP